MKMSPNGGAPDMNHRFQGRNSISSVRLAWKTEEGLEQANQPFRAQPKVVSCPTLVLSDECPKLCRCGELFALRTLARENQERGLDN